MDQPQNNETKVAGEHQQHVEHSDEDAHAANLDEHDTTVQAALRGYRWGVIWSLIVSMSVIMEGEFIVLKYYSRKNGKH